MLTVAFDKFTISRTQVQLWQNQFKVNREDVNDNARRSYTSRSTTNENIKSVKKMILDNRRIIIRKAADSVVNRSSHAKQFLRMF